MESFYKIEGTTNIDPEQSSGPYLEENFWPNFQEDILQFKNRLIQSRENKTPLSVLRLSHSEFCYINNLACGRRYNGPPNLYGRHWKSGQAPTLEQKCKIFESIINSDILSTQIGYDFKDWMNDVTNFKDAYLEYKDSNRVEELFNNTEIFNNYNKNYNIKEMIDIPMDVIYALIANKWILKTFKNKIGFIGAHQKVNYIKELMEHKKFQEFTGNDYFTDYIGVQQQQAINDPDLLKTIEKGVKKSNCDIFIMGMGISKLSVFDEIKNFGDCIFYDTGHGLDAIAGYGCPPRPYFGSWQNYRIKDKPKSVTGIEGTTHGADVFPIIYL
jgi:hypothetical protein